MKGKCSMQVNAIGTSSVNFKGEEKKTGGAGRAWCSVFIPGLGQFLDGRSGAGAAFMGSNVALNVAGGVGVYQILKSMSNNVKPSVAKMAIVGAASLISTVAWIWNIVDAYKGKRAPKTEEPKPVDVNA